jgi:radical SAM superfamily enzyme YgiQ (UPF0313 family)
VDRPYQPLGIAYLGAVLEKSGEEAFLIDSQLQKTVDGAIENVVQLEPDIVGFSVVSRNASLFKQMTEKTHRKLKNTPIIAGGPHCTARHVQILREIPYISAIVRGEGELVISELARRLFKGKDIDGIPNISYRKNKNIVVNPRAPRITDLDSLPFPARHLLPPIKYYENRGSIISSRGCCYHCTFCTVHLAFGDFGYSVWRPRDPKNVVDELECLVEMGASFVEFVDDNFLVDVQRAKRIAEEILSREIKINYKIDTRTDLILKAKSILPILRRSGCVKIAFGIENGSQEVLNRYEKGTTVQQNAKALSLLRKNAMSFYADWIMFDAKTTMANLEENLEFIKKNSLSECNEIFGTWLYPVPGSKVFEEYLNEKRLIPNETVGYTYRIPDLRVRFVFKTLLKFLVENKIKTRALVNLLRYCLWKIQTNPRKQIPKNVLKQIRLIERRIERATYRVFELLIEEARNERVQNEAEIRILESGEDLCKKYIEETRALLDLIGDEQLLQLLNQIENGENIEQIDAPWLARRSQKMI